MSRCLSLADWLRSVGSWVIRITGAGRWILSVVLLAFLVGGSAAHVRAATVITFKGEELLGKPTDTSITINIVPDSTIVYHYQYGTSAGSYTAQTSDLLASAGQPSELTITGLAPNTRYFYRMRYHLQGETDWVERDEHSFWTQRVRGSTFIFTVTSDSHAELNSNYRQAMINIRGDRPDLHFDLGDTFMLNWVYSQKGANNQYLAHRSTSYLGAIGPSTPIFLASGNHENEEGWNLDDTMFTIALWSIQARKAYYPTPIDNGFYFANLDPLAAIDEATYGDEYREDYYAWEWGDALFVVIDPFQYTMNLPYTPTAGEHTDDTKTGDQWSWTLGAQQFNWFKQTLENSDAKYKFVFSHHMTGGIPEGYGGIEPGYVRGGARAAAYFEWGGRNADGTPGFADHRNAAEFGVTPIHQLMVENGVSAYFHGHDHQYAYELRDGIVYQEVPSPSMSGNEFPGIYTEGDYGAYQTIKVLPSAGYLRVTVTPDQATVDYVRSDIAEISYSYTISERLYVLTTAVSPTEGGTVDPAAGIYTYSEGTVVSVTASSNPGYTFTGWSGDCSGVGDCQVTMDTNRSVTAHFTQDEYVLTVNVVGNGTVNKGPDQATYHYLDEVELTAIAEAGWSFTGWSGDLTGSENPTTVTIQGDTQITATFVDIVPPETVIDSGPVDPTNVDTASFEFSANEVGVTFECQLDGGGFVLCESPAVYVDLADGLHMFEVRATDAAGNVDPTPASHTWTIDTSPLTLTQLTLRQSLDKAVWTPVVGDLASGYTMPLDPAQDWYYLDVAELTASHMLADGHYGFLVEQAELPTGWLEYWAAKGVTADAAEPWQQQMWLIINGEAPIFYLRVAGAAYMLVDGLGYSLGQADDYLRVNGDYPLGAYAYIGSIWDVLGNDVMVTAEMAFIGPNAPAAPEAAMSSSGADVTLSWAAVTTDAGGNFTLVTVYQVFVSPEPYFTPDPTPGTGNLLAETSDLTYVHVGAVGSAGSHFYIVRAVNCVDHSANSNRVGAFAFQLAPGTLP